MNSLAAADNAICVSNLQFAYGAHQVLKDVSFVVPRGHVVGLLGSNGAGKTTLTRVLSTFLPVQSGKCTVGGYDCSTQALQVRQRIAVIPQGSSLNLELNVEQNILTYLRLHGLSKAEATVRLHHVSEQFGLQSYLQRSCMELSGGFRRRVQVARAFATSAECLLLDEASVGLDPLARQEFWKQIREMAGNRTILLTTQILEEAEVCDSLLFLEEGRIVAHGTPDQLKALHGKVRLKIVLARPISIGSDLATDLAKLKAEVQQPASDHLVLTLPNGAGDGLGEVIQLLYRNHLPIVQTAVTPPTLGDVFAALTRG